MNEEVCAGKPCLADTSIDVATVVGTLGTGKSFEEVKEVFQLTQEQIFTALRYASYVTDHLPLRMPASGSSDRTG
ncbi:MAG: DUF433 domain-containing protein [Nitrospirales bacterium]